MIVRHDRGGALVEALVWLSAVIILSGFIASLGVVVDRRQRMLIASRVSTWVPHHDREDSTFDRIARLASINPGTAEFRFDRAAARGAIADAPVEVAAAMSHASPHAASPADAFRRWTGFAEPNLSRTLTRSAIELDTKLGLHSERCEPTMRGNACLRETAAIRFADGAAIDPTVFHDRVAPWVATTALAPVGRTLSLAGQMPLLGELRGLEQALGHIDLQALPAYPESIAGQAGLAREKR